MSDIEVGDYVEVVSHYKCYDNYKSWAESVGFEIVRHKLPTIGQNYKVIAKGPHFSQEYKTLLGIQDLETGQNFVMDIEGVKKVDREQEELKALGKSLFGKKMRVTPETSELVQKAVFAAGGGWLGAMTKEVRNISEPYLHISSSGQVGWGENEGYFSKDRTPEVTLSTKTTLVVEEVKIDPLKKERLNRIKRMEKELEELKKSIEEE